MATRAARARQETPPGPKAGRSTYEEDFYAWAMEQAAHLRAGRADLLDFENIAEELEGLGRSEYRELKSSLARIMQHMLKWDHQPERRSRSRTGSINVHRERVRQCLRENPSLKPRVPEALADAYELAIAYAANDTWMRRSAFPQECPYDWEQVMERPFNVGDDD